MRDFINHYSLVFLLICLIGIVIFAISHYRDNRWILILLVGGLILLSFGYVQLRTGAGSTVTIDAFDNDLRAGTPVFVEFYSDF
jgi:hypothetical protein